MADVAARDTGARDTEARDTGARDTAAAVPTGTETADDPAHRGSLTIRQRAVERIAVAAASHTAGVRRHGNTLGRWTGRELPRVDAVVAGDHVRAAVEVAVDWGWPLSTVAAAVRDDVTAALAEHGGLTVDGVSVHVAAVIAPQEAHEPVRRVS